MAMLGHLEKLHRFFLKEEEKKENHEHGKYNTHLYAKSFNSTFQNEKKILFVCFRLLSLAVL